LTGRTRQGSVERFIGSESPLFRPLPAPAVSGTASPGCTVMTGRKLPEARNLLADALDRGIHLSLAGRLVFVMLAGADELRPAEWATFA
jgi:hypothetical protein